MPESIFVADAESFDEVQKLINKLERPADIIQKVFREFGADEVKKEIQKLLPESGRRWKGKKTAAKQAQPFRETFEGLTMTVGTKSAYNYLYFPDDGSTTKKHRGNQHFMQRGGDNAVEAIINRLVEEMTSALET